MRSARSLAQHALVQLELGKTRRLRDELDRATLSPRDMAFAYELAHGALRNERLLDAVLALLAHRGLPRNPPLRCALRLGAYQLLFLGGVAVHAAVNETVELVPDDRGFVNALLRRLSTMVTTGAPAPAGSRCTIAIDSERTLTLPPPGLPAADDTQLLALRHSLPDFLVARWQQAFGAECARICAASSAVPAVFLRAAALAGSTAALQAALAGAGVQCEPTAHPLVLRWSGGNSPFQTAAFRDGWFVAQDPTAVLAAEAVPAAPGATIVDLCAAPGTKTMLLAERVQPDGVVFAFDVEPRRRQLIVDNATRLRLERTVRVVETLAGLPPADAVLADQPCSNTGVLARRVEARRRLRPTTFAELAAVQRPILQQACGLVRAGGAVVHSTCSIEAEENGELVRAVLPPGFVVEREVTTLPTVGAGDGGYFAVLRAP